MRVIVAALLLSFSHLANAEVSDKLPTQSEIAASAAVAALIIFAISSWRWWLAAVGAIALLPYVAYIVELYAAPDLLQALWQEQGISYFAILASAVAAIIAASLSGGIRGWRQLMANNRLERSKCRAAAPPRPPAAQANR